MTNIQYNTNTRTQTLHETSGMALRFDERFDFQKAIRIKIENKRIKKKQTKKQNKKTQFTRGDLIKSTKILVEPKKFIVGILMRNTNENDMLH